MERKGGDGEGEKRKEREGRGSCLLLILSLATPLLAFVIVRLCHRVEMTEALVRVAMVLGSIMTVSEIATTNFAPELFYHLLCCTLSVAIFYTFS